MSTALLRKKNRLTIPAEIIRKTGLKENDPLEIEVRQGENGFKIVIEPLRSKKTSRRRKKLSLNELYENFSIEDSLGEEADFGEKVGEEVW